MKPKPKQRPILSFTVKLSKWRCGGDGYDGCTLGKGETGLVNNRGYMCCLGFAARAAGFKGKMLNLESPQDLNVILPGLTEDDGPQDSMFVDDAIRINDDTTTTIAHKKRALITLGKKHNIKIKFEP